MPPESAFESEKQIQGCILLLRLAARGYINALQQNPLNEPTLCLQIALWPEISISRLTFIKLKQ